jgi:hypothetical protein
MADIEWGGWPCGADCPPLASGRFRHRPKRLNGWLEAGARKRGETVHDQRRFLDRRLALLQIQLQPAGRSSRMLRRVLASNQLQGLTGQKGQPLSGSTRILLLSILDAIFQRAIRIGAASINPVRQLDRRDRPKAGPPRKRIATVDEERRLLLAALPWLRLARGR